MFDFEELLDMDEERYDRSQALERVPVLVADGPLTPPIGRLEDPLARKLQADWHNDSRNELIATIANGFAQRAIEELWTAGLMLDVEDFPLPEPWPSWVAVLVESLEHGRVLQQLLPDWHLLHACPDSCGPSSGNVMGIQAQYREITTLCAAAQFDAFAPNVLVIAMGGDWAFELDNTLLVSGQHKTIVVDVADDFDDVAERATRARLRAYAIRGWQVTTSSKWMDSWQSYCSLPAGQPLGK